MRRRLPDNAARARVDLAAQARGTSHDASSAATCARLVALGGSCVGLGIATGVMGSLAGQIDGGTIATFWSHESCFSRSRPSAPSSHPAGPGMPIGWLFLACAGADDGRERGGAYVELARRPRLLPGAVAVAVASRGRGRSDCRAAPDARAPLSRTAGCRRLAGAPRHLRRRLAGATTVLSFFSPGPVRGAALPGRRTRSAIRALDARAATWRSSSASS